MYRSNYPLGEGTEVEERARGPTDAPFARNSPLFLPDTTRLLPRISSHEAYRSDHFSSSPYFSR